MEFPRQENWSGLPFPSPAIPNKGNAKECSNHHTIAHISHASKVMLKILQDRLQQYPRELWDVPAGFRKGRGTRDQIANIRWIIEKARVFQKNIYFCFIDYAKAFDCVDHLLLGNFQTQESNQGLLHCRQILYQLSYPGSPEQTGYGSPNSPTFSGTCSRFSVREIADRANPKWNPICLKPHTATATMLQRRQFWHNTALSF